MANSEDGLDGLSFGSHLFRSPRHGSRFAKTFLSTPMWGYFFFIEILDEPLERSPPVIVGDPQTHFRILEGASVKFRCPIVGSDPFRVEWSLVRHESNHFSFF